MIVHKIFRYLLDLAITRSIVLNIAIINLQHDLQDLVSYYSWAIIHVYDADNTHMFLLIDCTKHIFPVITT